MNVSVLRTQLSGVLRRPGRILMTGLSVLVAALVVFGTVLAHQIVTRTMLDTFSNTPEAVSLVVASQGGTPITPEQLTQIRDTPGVTTLAGRTSVYVTAAGIDLDVHADPGTGPMSRVTLVAGTYPDGEREIALDRRAAERIGLRPGGTLRLDGWQEGAEPVSVTVTGVVDGPQDAAERGWAPDTVLDALAGRPGYPRVDLITAPGTDLDATMTRLGEQLLRDPSVYLSITTGETTRVREATDEVRQLDQVFALIGMFVGVAVVAAALVATSTFRIVFAQRMRQLALLRTIGAQRGQLVGALLAEGAVVGLVTGATGVLIALAGGLAAPVVAGWSGRTITGPGVPVGPAIAVVIGAVLITVGAVLAPAFAAAGVAPLQALRSSSVAGSERGVSAVRLVLGVLLTACAGGLIRLTLDSMDSQGDGNRELLYLLGVGTCAYGALIALGPLLIRPVLAAVGAPLRLLGPAGRLAVSGIGGTPRRAAAVSVVVALGVTMLAGTIVGISGMQTYTDRQMAVRTPADLGMFAEDGPLGADVVTGLRADGRFTDVTPFRTADFSGGQISHVAIDLDPAGLPALDVLEAEDGSLAAFGPGRAILADVVAADLGARAGDTVTLTSPAGGTVRLEVAAILTGEAPLRLGAVLTPADLTTLGGAGPEPTGVLANIASGTRNDALAAFRAIGAGAEIAVLADERDKAGAEIESLLFAALGLLGLTVLIAVVGVGTTTGLSVMERTRESGLLRALGMSRGKVRLMIGAEAGLYGLIGAVLGTALGVPLAWFALDALRLDIPWTFPAGRLLLIIVALAAITVLAGIVPARRAARVSPVAALSVD
ncbi:FtsX-like permease family protein [Catenuloplanes japonicus]|uniref:FtsX-like permease family protein n=1 Tax=Catenuloplanes japonicus TaxID=33876 RepID=UPI0005248FA8|nr:ABC transporter permease [Catenuloplanes japonicus]